MGCQPLSSLESICIKQTLIGPFYPNFHDGGALREMMVVRWDKWKLGYFADPAKGGKALGGVEEILAKEILDDTPADSR